MRDTDSMQIFERRMDAPPVPQEEGLRILRGLGLEVVPMPELGELWCYEYALNVAGGGAWDYDAETWTPSSSQFFSFDAEAFDVERMYLHYFDGLQSISRGELSFSDVVQDNGGVDWETPGGTVAIRLRLNGADFAFAVDFEGDWLDVRIQKAVNQALETLGVQKRFYSIHADQGCVVFFCTEAWARAFEEATLCFMSYNGD